MFAGIVEATGQIEEIRKREGVFEILVSRPAAFNSLELGESIAIDGVCLTLEKESQNQMQFALGPETVEILKLDPQSFLGKKVNLERSLAFGDKVHGHLVSGHVECLGSVTSISKDGGVQILDVHLPESFKAFVWNKGSVAINGVSLTVNKVTDLNPSDGCIISLCIIPETLKRTNLGDLLVSSSVNIETDYLSKSLLRAHQTGYFLKGIHGI